MELDQEHCYRALKSRDARFDGQFFTAVTTTGIYCRPICPAPTPRRAHVQFFRYAAAAQEAGFRPCLRCRPETSPGTPAWQGTSATVSRALRLIEEGVLDEGGVEALALKLGVGGRHLRRLFTEHIGVTPVSVAQTRRLHFAKKLIDETRLPMGDIAFAAGYASIRRFNTALRSVYGRAPRELRRQSAREETHAPGVPLKLRLAYRPPFDWDAMLAFLADRATAGVEQVEDGVYRRTIRVGEHAGFLEVVHRPESNQLLLTIHHPDVRALQVVTARVRRMFDLEACPPAIAAVLERDPLLRPLLRKYPGLRVPGAWDPFEMAVRVIVGQQISVKGATTLAGRIAQTYGRPIEASPFRGLDRLAPLPADLAEADLVPLGIVSARSRAIQGLAKAVMERRVNLDRGGDFEAAVQALEALPGLGPWTAQVVAMRALGEPDAFPAADLGLIRALESAGLPASTKNMLHRAETWRPWRAYAALYLWKLHASSSKAVTPRKPKPSPPARSRKALSGRSA